MFGIMRCFTILPDLLHASGEDVLVTIEIINNTRGGIEGEIGERVNGGGGVIEGEIGSALTGANLQQKMQKQRLAREKNY